jgi:hypothetical protein
MGPPKRGKTALLAEWLRRWRDGRPICGMRTNRPTSLGIITTDHKWQLNQGQWFEKVGFPDIAHYALRDDPDTPWRKLHLYIWADSVFDRALNELRLTPGGLVMVDVIGPFITSRLNDYAEVVGGLGTISQNMDRRGLTCLAISHMGKQKGDAKDQYKDPFERILGSGAQIGFSDTMFYLLGPKDIDQPFFEVGWLPTHAPSGTFRFQRNDAGLFVPDPNAVGPLGVSSHDAPSKELRFLALMPTEPPGWSYGRVTQSIATVYGVKTRRAKQLLMQLRDDGRLRMTEAGHYVGVRIA